MAIIRLISSLIATAVHGGTSHETDAEKARDQQQAAYYPPDSYEAYMNAPCNHSQYGHGSCGMCRHQRRREWRWERKAERRAERAVDRASRRGQGCHRGRCHRRCYSPGPVMVVAAPIAPVQQVRSQELHQQRQQQRQQQQQGVQSLEALRLQDEGPSQRRERPPPSYETVVGEKGSLVAEGS